MNREELIEIIRRKGVFLFSRSGGPGGQNVNKVNSRVQLKVPLAQIKGLSEAQRVRLVMKMGRRLVEENQLMIFVEDTRDQHRNREIAIERLTGEILASLKRPKKRVATRPTKASRERKKQQKQNRKQVKNLRKKVDY